MQCTDILGPRAEHSFTDKGTNITRAQVFVIAEENSGPLYHWSIDITCTGPGQLRNRFQFSSSSCSDILNWQISISANFKAMQSPGMDVVPIEYVVAFSVAQNGSEKEKKLWAIFDTTTGYLPEKEIVRGPRPLFIIVIIIPSSHDELRWAHGEERSLSQQWSRQIFSMLIIWSPSLSSSSSSPSSSIKNIIMITIIIIVIWPSFQILKSDQPNW